MACTAADPCRTTDLFVGPFRVSFAAGSGERTEEYRLRYEIFVEERGFEPADRFPDRLECDEFDAASCSALLRHGLTGEVAACQRLILPDYFPEGTLTNFERECRPLPGRPRVDLAALPRHSWAEASRTTVAPRFRWGGSASAVPAMVGIKYASIALALAFDRTTLFSLSDPRTARLIRRLGFPMVQIGAPIEFHGCRAPFRMDVDAMVRSVGQGEQALLDTFVHQARMFVRGAREFLRGPARVA